MTVKDRIVEVRKRIRKACIRVGRGPGDVRVIAVTKYVSNETAKEAIAAGTQHLGENRDTGFLEKWEAFGHQVTWHFIGTLQSRKVKNIINKVDYLHSLDRLSLAKEIEERATSKVKCFVQVNASGESSKHGVPTDQVVPFVSQLADFPKIEVVGLMTMAPQVEDPEETRPVFRRLKALQKVIQTKKWGHAVCDELSMGMSNDFEVAVEEGATFIRIGTALVGKR